MNLLAMDLVSAGHTPIRLDAYEIATNEKIVQLRLTGYQENLKTCVALASRGATSRPTGGWRGQLMSTAASKTLNAFLRTPESSTWMVLRQASLGYTGNEGIAPRTAPLSSLEVVISMPNSRVKRINGLAHFTARKTRSLENTDLLILDESEMPKPYGRKRNLRSVVGVACYRGRAKTRPLE